MKKVLSTVLVALMLAGSATSVQAAADTLDIEKVAIATVKNSQMIQTSEGQVSILKKHYVDAKSAADGMRRVLPYNNSYQIVENIIMLPLQMENALTQAQNRQFVVTNAVRLSAYQGYINALKANYAETVRQNVLNSLDADYKKAQLQESTGEITASDLRLSEIAYQKAQYQYKGAQQAADSAMMALNNLMGEDLAKQYSSLQDVNIMPSAKIQPLEGYVNSALAGRAEITNAQSALDYKKKQYEEGIAEIPTDFQFYKQKQEYAITSAENDLELAKINVQEDISTLYVSLEGAMKNLETMKINYDQAVTNFQIAQSQYENGQISLLELDDAKVAQAEADINYKEAQLDAWLMQTTMNTACGAGYRLVSSLTPSDFPISQFPSENKPQPVDHENDH